ncbi:MAG: hypothetical protein RSE12_08535 [Fuscovulum sp.]|nr:MAG: hypothetical protein RSE12_08535 [Fuscovulum sp.]
MAGFYSARSETIPPLPWPNFAPPFPDHQVSLSTGLSNGFTQSIKMNLKPNIIEVKVSKDKDVQVLPSEITTVKPIQNLFLT